VQLRDFRRELVPDPDREQFRGRVFEAGDFVENVVVEAIDDGIDGAFQIGEIHQPSDRGIDRSAHRHFAAERVAVHAPALVSRGYVR